MTATLKQHQHQLKQIINTLPAKTPELLKQFVGQFYAKMPTVDLLQYEPKMAAALAANAYAFIEERKKLAPKMRIFTPNKKESGYESKRVVIELLNDDMPFLVDSLTAELTRLGLTITETLHPILHVERDKNGALISIVPQGNKKTRHAESFIHFEVMSLPETLPPAQLKSDLAWVLEHIRAAVSDWQAIMHKAAEHIQMLPQSKASAAEEDVAENQDFLRWLTDRNFVFMGYAEYDFFDNRGQEKLRIVEDSKLGIFKIPDEIAARGLEALPPELRHFLLVPQSIEITKSTRRSLIHRPVPMDYIGIKRFDAHGKVIGEARFLGLFTSNVYYQSTEHVPLVRRKVARVLERSDFALDSHDGKALKAILEFLPRDEIFQMSEDDLFDTSMGILALEAKPRVRVFVRKDAFERFVSAMVFIPKERFSTELRHQIQYIVKKAFNGTLSSFATQIGEAPLARLHLTVKTAPGDIPEVDIQALEADIAKCAYLWSDLLAQALTAHHGEEKAEGLRHNYATAFPQSYVNRYDTSAAVHDIGKIEECLVTQQLTLELFAHKNEGEAFLHLKIYHPHEEIALSDILPILENAGFRVIEEQPFLIQPQARSSSVWIRDFKLQVSLPSNLSFEAIKPRVEALLLKVWRSEVESDRFNALALKAGLEWQQVQCLRGYAKYLRQTGFTYSQTTMEQALEQQVHITVLLMELFHARFLLTRKDAKKELALKAQIEEQLSRVTNAVEDRILRRYMEVILATLRTNYFQAQENGAPKAILSFKFDSHQVPELPLPRPFAEIFVYSPRVEGIHLRGGKVARGGLRWSDRHEDFRTEVLGLMKAQMVKNSVIVPVGSKGGFVVKRPPVAGTRDAVMEEGIACYTLYLQGLLDITDNIVGGKVVPPANVARHDGDDPYLVVAADKGTATFSDIANSVSARYGFWLGDAFASGGSVGYDHKKMAITARGAWVSVQRHFSEMGVDIEKQEFTTVGIGDMAGDVFGNGMLLSNKIALVAAFNHMHIFIDPTPDAARSFKERERLFHLPRSTWKDYDAELISRGGGIYERAAKTITLSKEAQNALGITKSTLTPDELIRAILLAPVDLLWNGGIGTYVKAEEETHDQVGDRANNAVRVNGKELRCKLVGEGGNLGFTQKGRIEYARQGGRINTDAIDNSAGVDCSDHEVNIKIAFSHLLADGTLSAKKRDTTLARMTDEVAGLVLKDNILQTQAITVQERQGAAMLEAHIRLMHKLEQNGLLDRTIEFLPTDKQLADMKASHKGLSRPEIAVLLAYSKMALYNALLASTLPDEEYFVADLLRYFPKSMQTDYKEAIIRHPLKREIIATVVTNSMCNRAGMTFFFDVADELDAAPRDVACAYTLARDAFGLRAIWQELEKSPSIAGDLKAELYAMVAAFLQRATAWVLRHMPCPVDIRQVMREVAPGIAELHKANLENASNALRDHVQQVATRLTQHQVSPVLAHSLARLEVMVHSFDIIAIAHATGKSVLNTGTLYVQLGGVLHFDWLRHYAEAIVTSSHWDRVAVRSLVQELENEQQRLCTLVIQQKQSLDVWLATVDKKKLDALVAELKTGDAPGIAKLMAALQYVRAIGN